MHQTFAEITFPFVVGVEGKWGADPHDRGNWTSGRIGQGELKGTKYGIAAMAYPNLDIKNLTLEDARAIMERDYASKVAYDAQPPGVDVSVFDMGYNAGPTRSNILLARVLGENQHSAAPFLAGKAQAAADKVKLIKDFAAKRTSFYYSLNNVRYINGWLKRAARCEALSVKTWLTYGEKKQPEQVKKDLQAHAKAAEKSTTKSVAGAGSSGGAGGVGASQHSWTFHFDWTTAVEIVAVVTVAAVVCYFIYRAYAHTQRAAAYTELTKE